MNYLISMAAVGLFPTIAAMGWLVLRMAFGVLQVWLRTDFLGGVTIQFDSEITAISIIGPVGQYGMVLQLFTLREAAIGFVGVWLVTCLAHAVRLP